MELFHVKITVIRNTKATRRRQRYALFVIVADYRIALVVLGPRLAAKLITATRCKRWVYSAGLRGCPAAVYVL